MASGVYKITNIINGNIYIGSAINLARREGQHFRALERGDHRNRHLQNAYRKYGAGAFVYEVLELCDAGSVVTREQFYIDTLFPEYNIAPLAGSSLGIKHTEETCKKIKDYHTGRKLSSEHRARIGNGLIGNKNTLGKKLTEDHRKKISISLIGNTNTRGRKLTNEQKQKISQSLSGRVFSDEHRKKLSEAGVGRSLSKESISKIWETRRKNIAIKESAVVFLEDEANR